MACRLFDGSIARSLVTAGALLLGTPRIVFAAPPAGPAAATGAPGAVPAAGTPDGKASAAPGDGKAPAAPGDGKAPAADAKAHVPGDVDGYLVVPFQNASPTAALDWMSSALAVTVAEKLESHPALRPSYGASILEGVGRISDPARVAAHAADVGARYVFTGSFNRPNWKAQVTVKLYEVTPDTPPQLQQVGEASATGERNQLLELLDQAMLDVLKQRGFSVEGERLAALRRPPTRDLYAFTLYGRALNQTYGIGTQIDEAAAQKGLARAINIDPKFAEAHRQLGVVCLDKGETGRASSQYAQALDLRPGYYAPLVGLARLYRAEGRRTPALEMAQRALEVRPYDDEMRFLLGTLEMETQDFDKALVDLQKVTTAHPHHLGAHRALVQVYAEKGMTAELANELEQVALLIPDDVDVKLDLGAAYIQLGKAERAIAAFEEVLKRRPKNAQALKFSGDLYRKIGDTERALAAYEKLRRVSPEDPRPYFLLAAVYSQAGNLVKAEQVLQDAQQFRRYLGEVWLDLGVLALRRGNLSTANWYLSRAVQKAPSRPKAHYNYALALDASNQRTEALAELRQAADLDPDDADVHYLTGVIDLRLGKLVDAKLAFAEALKRNPQHADAQHNMSLLEDLEKRYGSEHAAVGAE